MKETFRDRLIELKNGASLSCTDLAKGIHCSNSTISRYINDLRMPKTKIFIKLADFFCCSVDYLYGVADDFEEKEYLPCPLFSEQIPFLLKFLNVSALQFCIETDISSTEFYMWKNNKKTPSIESIYKISKFYDYSMDFILGRK